MAPKSALLRLVLDASCTRSGRRTAVFDSAQRLPGRGAYLCRDGVAAVPAAACLAHAIRRGGLSRAFRAPVSIAPEFVESSL